MLSLKLLYSFILEPYTIFPYSLLRTSKLRLPPVWLLLRGIRLDVARSLPGEILRSRIFLKTGYHQENIGVRKVCRQKIKFRVQGYGLGFLGLGFRVKGMNYHVRSNSSLFTCERAFCDHTLSSKTET